MKKHTPAIHNAIAPTHEKIAALAQHLYEEEGCPDGRADAHWLAAERQLRECADSSASPQTGNGVATLRSGGPGLPSRKSAR